MVEIANKDTYGIEDLGGGILIRRRVMAGTKIPSHLKVGGEQPASRPAPPPQRGVKQSTPEPVKPSPVETSVTGPLAGETPDPKVKPRPSRGRPRRG